MWNTIKMENNSKLINFANKIFNFWILKSIRIGFTKMLPIILIGTFVELILKFPSIKYEQVFSTLLGGELKNGFIYIYEGIFSVLSLITFISISYQLLSTSKTLSQFQYPPPALTLIATVIYMIFIRHTTGVWNTSMDDIKENNFLIAILSAVVISCLFIFFHNHRIIKIKKYTGYTDIIFEKVIKLIEPAIWTILSVTLIRIISDNINIHVSLDTFHYVFAKTGELGFALYYRVASQFLYFFGISANHALHGIVNPIISNATITNETFFNVFVGVGGGGAGIGIILALILTNRKRVPRIVKLAALPTIFGIKDIMLYGLPIVANPFLFIPFLLAPIIATPISYLAFYWGLVPPITDTTVTWTSPIFYNGFKATGSILGTILQLVNVGIAVLINYPFVKIYMKQIENSNKEMVSKLIKEVLDSNYTNILERNDDLGFIARLLLQEILKDFQGKRKYFSLAFQPQVTNKNEVYGAEALLRFQDPVYGFIPPPIVAKLMQEVNMEHKLGYYVIEEAIKAQKKLMENSIDIILSINMSGTQLKDESLVNFIKNTMNEYGIEPRKIKFELLETEDLLEVGYSKKAIAELKYLGCKIAVDDFGMGHSTLMYIKSFNIDTIKIDGLLIKDIVTNKESASIVKSICDLANELDLSVIAEFVETKEQKELLEKLNCNIYQGYYYSKPEKLDDIVDYINRLTGIR